MALLGAETEKGPVGAEQPRADWTLYPRRIENNVFVSDAPHVTPRRAYGGRLLAEALVAAGLTASEGFAPHSLSGLFLRPAETDKPIRYEVDALRDGRRLVARSVRIVQSDKVVSQLLVSMAADRTPSDRDADMPDVPHPDSLPSEAECKETLHATDPRLANFLWARKHPIEIRPVDFESWTRGESRDFAFWFRAAPPPLPDDSLARSALVVYASDRFLLTTSLLRRADIPLGKAPVSATVSHSIWLHRDYAPDSWLLSHVQSRTLARSHTFVRSEIFAANGDQIASIGQEGLFTTRPLQAPDASGAGG